MVKIHVDLPPGLPAARARLFFDPETTEQFEAIVEACGGPGSFRVSGGDAWADVDGGAVCVWQPKDLRPPALALHPFMAAFKARVDEAREARERVEQMT